MSSPLSDAELSDALAALPSWTREADGRSDALVQTRRFADFRAAVAFIVRVAFEAEEAGHHPEITNVYDRVTLRLTTHDAGNRLTERDVALARAIDQLAS